MNIVTPTRFVLLLESVLRKLVLAVKVYKYANGGVAKNFHGVENSSKMVENTF